MDNRLVKIMDDVDSLKVEIDYTMHVSVLLLYKIYR